jgi:hypothetical protein
MTWSTGQVPTAGSVVSIGSGDVVTYDVVSDTAVKTVAIQTGGSLFFRTDVNTRLTVINLLVMDGGALQIGTAATPVEASVKAEVVFADVPLDSVNDPLSYGNGLIALGKVTMYGAAKSATFVNLAFEPLAGTTTLTLAQPVTGWMAGDRLILPDTRQVPDATEEWERPTLAGVSADGLTLTLSQPLQFNHLGAHDPTGTLRFLPDVGNLTRNVVMRSQSATGTRGQTFFTQRADVDIRYAQFTGLGRTTNDMPDDTTLDANGNVTHVGTNQMGRYPVHFAHLIGPAAIPADGYQFTFVGNAVWCPLDPMPFRWGIDIQGSDYGLVKDNVLYNWAGAGIVTDDGSESYNVIDHNYVVRITGIGGRASDRGDLDFGFEGAGFWFRTGNNYISNNISADIAGGYGYTIYQRYTSSIKVPSFQGADPSVDGQYTLVNMNAQALREFSNNEAYAVSNGLTVWWVGTVDTVPIISTPESLIQNLHVWNVAIYGFYGYPVHHVTFDGYIAIDDTNIVANTGAFSDGLYFGDYMTSDFLVRNSDIEGFRTGILVPSYCGGDFTVRDSYLRNYADLNVISVGAPGSQPDSAVLPGKTTIIRNVTFDQITTNPLGWPTANIQMTCVAISGCANFVVPDDVYVYDYNKVAGDNFRVFYNEQNPNYIMPQTVGTSLIGSPVAGLTNQQNWNQYGIAMAGAVAPSNQTRAGIVGLIAPIGNPVGGVLTGHVYRDTNKNGVLDANEAGEPNVIVYIDLNGNNVRDPGEPSATTDVNGNYSLVVNTDGSYVARCDLANSSQLIQTTANPAAQSVSGGATVTVSPAFGVALNLHGGILTGQVYRDMNKNGVLDAGEVGEPNVIVFADLNNSQTRDAGEPWTTTDANGDYSLPINADGSYVVRIDLTAAGNTFQTTAVPTAVSVAGGATVTVSPAFGVYHTGGIVTGLVYFDANRNGQRDANENAEAGVTVFVDANNDGKLNASEISAVTNSSGAFTLSVPTDGNYSIRQVLRNGQFASTTNPTQVSLSGGNTITVNFGSTSVFAVGSGAGTTATVQVYNPDGSLRATIIPYGTFAGGVRVATGDINGDGVPDIITAPGAGGGPHIRVYSGTTFQLIRAFFAYSVSMTSGVFVATGDVDGDGHTDIITGAGVGIGVHTDPRIRVFSGVNNAILRDFSAFPDTSGASKYNTYNVGATVAAADFNNDGKADIVVGPESGNPNVIVYSGADTSPAPTKLRDFFAYAPITPGGSLYYPVGAYVAAGDYNGDGVPDIITGAGINVATGIGGGSHVRVFSGGNKDSIALEFFAYPNLNPEFKGGVRVGAVDLDGDGRIDILAAPGVTSFNPPGITDDIRAYSQSQAPFMNFQPFGDFLGGAYVG